MKPGDEKKLTFDEEVELLYQQMMASRLPKPRVEARAAPKPAVVQAGERWAQPKPIEAVLQDAQRAPAILIGVRCRNGRGIDHARR